MVNRNTYVKLENPAPGFDCGAVANHEVVEFNWNQLHEKRILVLQYDSIKNYTDLPDNLVALSNSVGYFGRLQSNAAVVFRAHVFEIPDLANRFADEGGPGEIAIPIIVDSDDRIASMYEMHNAEEYSLWGHVIIDPVGRFRQIEMSSVQFGLNVVELVRFVASISHEES